ncbi:hypothetical protein tinsulaeT_34160 [Thalassotalea insulae]|uniref:RDD domain-containing protein n=1 Tax=Thalassotalea insulae TaxID=2056778 RepID=A0ABQ6H0W9_9GAMM|nr:RDD family protein [Thalassotalea insulae]GLX80076.1 hypothetical protein tinsulaeT_34160 [Thalassotalea insulae]
MVDKKQIIAVEEAQGASPLDAEETKKILTPFAFEIDKSLFGLPLAVPWKRGLALLIDFILIALLAETPGELLAFVVAMTFFRLGSKKRAQQQGKKRNFRRRLLRYFGAMMLLVLLLSTLPEFIEQYTDSASAEISEMAKPVIEQSSAPLKELEKRERTNAPHSNSEMIYKGVEWLKGLINDLGLSFGWAAFYFSVLTAIWHGQTPGKRLMQIKVIQLDGTPLSVWDSFGRYGGYGAGLATGLLGFIQIYWDPNRQAIHDKISSTVVIDLKKLNSSEAH